MIKIKIPGMMCSHCEARVRNAIEKSGGKVISLDLETKVVELETPQSFEELAKMLSDIGFEEVLFIEQNACGE